MDNPPFDPIEVPEHLDRLFAEISEAFESDRFAVLRYEHTVAQMYAAAALAHCCHLAQVTLTLHRSGEELAARLVARGVFESWLVGLFVHFGGYEATAALANEFHYQVQTQLRDAEQHDEQLNSARKTVRRKNKMIAANNAAKLRWNEVHEDEVQKPLDPLLPDPVGVTMDPDWSTRMLMFAGTTPESVVVEDHRGELVRVGGKTEAPPQPPQPALLRRLTRRVEGELKRCRHVGRHRTARAEIGERFSGEEQPELVAAECLWFGNPVDDDQILFLDPVDVVAQVMKHARSASVSSTSIMVQVRGRAATTVAVATVLSGRGAFSSSSSSLVMSVHPQRIISSSGSPISRGALRRT